MINFMNQKGQAILLVVLLTGVATLVLTAISGYMTLERLRMSSNINDSTQAILAADAGIECGFYNYYKSGGLNCSNGSACPGNSSDIAFDNNRICVFTEASTTDSVFIPAPVGDSFIKSVGASSRARRAFMVSW